MTLILLGIGFILTVLALIIWVIWINVIVMEACEREGHQPER